MEQLPQTAWVRLDGVLLSAATWLDSLLEQGVTIPKHPAYEGEVWTDYSRLDSVLSLNGCPQAEQFLLVKKTIERIDLE
jgi:hypothetical protein